MKKRVILPSLLWMVIGIVICINSAGLRLGSWRHPEPGLFPFLVGSIIVILSVSLTLSQFLKKSQDEIISWPDSDGLKRILIVFASLIFYALALVPLGFVLCTFVFFVAIFKSLGRKTWRYAILASLTVAVLAYLIFQVGLKTNLPTGPLGV